MCDCDAVFWPFIWACCVSLCISIFCNRRLQKTLYKQVDGVSTSIRHDTDNCKMSSARYLSLWLGLQHLGHDGVATRIQHSLNLVDLLITSYCLHYILVKSAIILYTTMSAVYVVKHAYLPSFSRDEHDFMIEFVCSE